MKLLNTTVNRFMIIVQAVMLVSVFLILGSCGTKNPVGCFFGDDCPEWRISAIDYDACWSPDGDSLVFAHILASTPDSSGIYIMDTGGVSKRFVLWVPVANSTRWSPKGDWIVFHSSAQIYKIKTNGDSLTQLTFSGRNFFPNWSPNGSKIAYWKSTPVDSNGVWIMNADGSDNKFIVDGGFPSWSPDGSKILFVGLGYQLYISDTAGRGITQLTSLTGGTGTKYPSFSPIGDKIVFSFQPYYQLPQVWVMNSDGSNLKQLTTEGGEWPCWSPDGTKIVYTNLRHDNGRLWIMNLDGTGKRQITF